MEKEMIKLGIKCQEKLLSDSEEILSNAPEGTLYVRERKRGNSYYQVYKSNKESKLVHRNINNEPQIIHALIEKKVAEKRVSKCTANINLLKNMLAKYEPCNSQSIFAELPGKIIIRIL